MATIYELTDELLNLLAMAEDEAMDEESAQGMIALVEEDLEKKADGYWRVYKELEGRASAMKAEEKRIANNRKVIENNMERIKKTIESVMIATGKKKFKTDLFTFSIAKNPGALKVNDDLDWNEIPSEYIIFPDPQINKDMVKEAIKNGQEFDWARIEQGEGIRVK